MSAYMRDQFSFFGIRSADRVAIQRRVFGERRGPEVADVASFARLSWQREERECQYAACDLTRKYVRRLGPSELPLLGELITMRSWWDTVDSLAVTVGAIVRAAPGARSTMDAWLAESNMWLVRVAILHQERWRSATDAAWLFAACRAQAAHPDFFVRKAIGWALRSYAKAEPAAVRAFLDTDGSRLSGLSRREAERGVAMGLGRLSPHTA
jgi:3-methyladenine DNA glycosylase AlkD